MNNTIKKIVITLVVYFLAWTVSYSIIFFSGFDELDFTYYFEYLFLAWTFSGGEYPAFIWFFSIVLFIPAEILAIYLMKKFSQE